MNIALLIPCPKIAGKNVAKIVSVNLSVLNNTYFVTRVTCVGIKNVASIKTIQNLLSGNSKRERPYAMRAVIKLCASAGIADV